MWLRGSRVRGAADLSLSSELRITGGGFGGEMKLWTKIQRGGNKIWTKIQRGGNETYQRGISTNEGARKHVLLPTEPLKCELMKALVNTSSVGRSEPLKLKSTAYIFLQQILMKFYFYLPIHQADGKDTL